MSPQAKGALLLAVVGGILTIIKLIIQARAAREAAADKLIADAEVARLRRDADERAMRHAREAEERAQDAEERKADREQKEKLISEGQAANTRTLDFLEAQLRSQQEAGAKRYEIIERNTAANETMATSLMLQAQELRVLVDRVAKIEGGAGCRARTN